MLRLRDSKEFTLEHMISQGQPRKSKILVPDQHQFKTTQKKPLLTLTHPYFFLVTFLTKTLFYLI